MVFNKYDLKILDTLNSFDETKVSRLGAGLIYIATLRILLALYTVCNEEVSKIEDKRLNKD